MDGLVNRKLTRNLKCIKTAYYHHRSLYFPCSSPLHTPTNVNFLNSWINLRVPLISIHYNPPKAFVFLFRTYFPFIGKRAGGTSSISSLSTDLTLKEGGGASTLLHVPYKVIFHYLDQ